MIRRSLILKSVIRGSLSLGSTHAKQTIDFSSIRVRGTSFPSTTPALLRPSVAVLKASQLDFLFVQRRCVRHRATAPKEDRPEQEESGTTEGETKEEGQEEKKESEEKPEKSHFETLKDDLTQFPEIYNAVSGINFILFTVFCLCSTGSQVEVDWWLEHWGIDAAFRPWAWLLHSFHMNNFMSMSFAMMLVHSMCHSVLPNIGNRGLLEFWCVISVVSGFCMWVGNYLANNTTEKQFGPWDVIAGLFVMQYLHQGFTPVTILNSFQGWVKYACWVGSFCILYYDWQPTVMGTVLGLLLCKTRFKPPAVAQ